VLVSLIIILILVSSVPVSLAKGPQQPLQQNQNALTAIIYDTYVNLRKNNEMSPEAFTEKDTDIVLPIQSAHQRYWWAVGPLGLGTNEWRLVGRWESDPLKNDLIVREKITFGVWLNNDWSVSGEIRYTLFNNEDQILQVESPRHSVNEEPKYFTTKGDGGNLSGIYSGDVLALQIEAKINGGANLIFGSPSHNSGFLIRSDSLKLSSVHACEKEVVAEYMDAFRVNPARLATVLKIDGSPQNVLPSADISETGNYVLVWQELEVIPGDHFLEVQMAYSPFSENDTKVVKMGITFKVDEPAESTLFGLGEIANLDLGLIVMLIVFVIVLIVLGVTLRRRKRKRAKKSKFKAIKPARS